MAPNRILLIRHAEKPAEEDDVKGIDTAGRDDPHSLSVRGWQRAGALARLFCPRSEAEFSGLVPDVVFAAGVGESSLSLRPQQTVLPLVALLHETRPNLPFITSHLNHQIESLIADLSDREGIVLISWEHKLIPEVVKQLPQAPDVPARWPDNRYDLIWLLDRNADSWTFRQIPQLLLSGDHDGLIM
jgi:broad specificity phosphatase PhoE